MTAFDLSNIPMPISANSLHREALERLANGGTPRAGTYTLAEMNAIANRMTFHKARAMAMGFTFTRIWVEYPGNRAGTIGIYADFVCICGKPERFFSNPPLPRYLERNSGWFERELDVAQQLHRLGSFSRDHLLADGYSPGAIDEIERKAQAFDDECVAELAAKIDERMRQRMGL